MKDNLQKIKEYYEELKTTNMSKIDKGKFLSTEAYSCTLNNGHTIIREKILKDGKDGDAVIVFPITINGDIIVAIEPRVFTEKTVDIGFPAGYIDDGEMPIDAAKRELLEETGYESNNWIYLGSFYQDQGCSSAYNHYYLANNCKKVKEQNLDEGEFIKYLLVSESELNDLKDEGYITSLNSAYVMEKAKTYKYEM